LKKEGNANDVVQSKLLTYALSLQDTQWMLRSRDRHLIDRKMDFFQKSKRVTLLSWKARLDVPLKLAEDSINDVGQDFTSFFGPIKLCDVSIERPGRPSMYPHTSGGSVSELSGTSRVQSDVAYEAKIGERYKRTGVPFLVGCVPSYVTSHATTVNNINSLLT